MDGSYASLVVDLLYRAQGATEHAHWLLLDPTLRSLAAPSLLGSQLADRDVVRVSISGGLDSALWPVLVPYSVERASDADLVQESVNEAHSELAPAALASGAGRRVCGWIDADCDASTLSRHVASYARQRRRGGGVLLRWFDPAVLWAMWPLLSEVQQTRLLGPIKSFNLLDPAGSLVRLKARNAPTDSGGLDLSNRQWRRIDHIAPLNALLRKLPAACRSAKPLDQIRFLVMASFQRAEALGFTDAQDLEAFGMYAVTIHPTFDTHPIISDRLQGRTQGDYFSALVDDLSADQWAKIGADLSTSPSMQKDSSI